MPVRECPLEPESKCPLEPEIECSLDSARGSLLNYLIAFALALWALLSLDVESMHPDFFWAHLVFPWVVLGALFSWFTFPIAWVVLFLLEVIKNVRMGLRKAPPKPSR